jgi:uncharacterized membrane protein (DUF4010 family)
MGNFAPFFAWLPAEGVKILLVLFLSFLVGLEREEHANTDPHRGFGGVRTYPLIGLVGYALALLAGTEVWIIAFGLLAISLFLAISYWHKLAAQVGAGITSEMSALAIYLVGALVSHEQFWIATTLAVASVFLLELKVALEGLAKRIAAADIFTFTKFLLLTAVILPVIPDANYTQFAINPYKTWLVVVAVSGVSYGSYVVQKLARGRGGIVLAAILGGAYSSTVTTIVLAREAVNDPRTYTVSGAMLMASGVMYLRLAVLVSMFNSMLMVRLAPAFVVLAVVAVLAGWLWSRREAQTAVPAEESQQASNPLEIRAALLFAVFFVAMLVVGHLAARYLGRSGVYTLALVMGVSDVDPFILSLTQAPAGSSAAGFAAPAIVIAAASNNLAKGVYAFAIAPRATGRKSLLLLAGLAATGLVPLLF